MRAPVLLCLWPWRWPRVARTSKLQQEIRRVRVLAIKAEPAELTFNPDAPTHSAARGVHRAGGGARGAPGGRGARAVQAGQRLPERAGVPGQGWRHAARGPAVAAGSQRAADAPGDAPKRAGTGGEPLDPNDPQQRAVLERGMPLFVGYEASDGTDTPEGLEEGVRRLTLRLTATPNQNPRLEEHPPGRRAARGPAAAEHRADAGPQARRGQPGAVRDGRRALGRSRSSTAGSPRATAR